MTTKSLHADLAEVMAEVGYVQKDNKVEGPRGYRYASAEAVLKKVNASLSQRGIAISSAAELLQYRPYTKEPRVSAVAVVRLTVRFTRGDESLEVQGLGEGADYGDKATMKANTAAIKYVLANAFMISWGDDPEADVGIHTESQGEEKPKATRKRTSARAKTAAEPDKLTSIALRIAAAKSTAELEPIKLDILALQPVDKDAYKRLRTTYKERLAEILPLKEN